MRGASLDQRPFGESVYTHGNGQVDERANYIDALVKVPSINISLLRKNVSVKVMKKEKDLTYTMHQLGMQSAL